LDARFKKLRKENKRLSEEQILDWFVQLLSAVNYMHSRRVLHRDLKARNIFLKNETIKIGDFGISRILMGTMDMASTFTGTVS
jgi:NIMA (never in mitosis gene a)-related kinase 11